MKDAESGDAPVTWPVVYQIPEKYNRDQHGHHGYPDEPEQAVVETQQGAILLFIFHDDAGLTFFQVVKRDRVQNALFV